MTATKKIAEEKLDESATNEDFSVVQIFETG
jgi:hypothetical protein